MRRRYISVAVVAAVACGPTGVAHAQLGAGAGVIIQAVKKAQDAVNKYTKKAMDSAASEIVGAIKDQTKQLSGNQEKMIAALEEMANAEATIRTLQKNDELRGKILTDHQLFPDSCLSPTGGVGVTTSEEAREQYREQVSNLMGSWNKAEEREDSSVTASANALRQRLDESNGEGDVTDALEPGILMTSDRLDGGDVDKSEALIRLLTNPAPEAFPADNGDAISSDAFLRAASDRSKAQLSQSVVSESLVRRMPSADLSDWYSTVTGKDPGNGVSLIQVWKAEANRRYGRVEWYGDLQAAPQAAVMREMAQMQAFENYMLVQMVLEQEKANMLAAAQLRDGATDKLNKWSAATSPTPAATGEGK